MFAFANNLAARSTGFDPLSLASCVGWYDFTDRSTLYQDAAGTTPATSVSDPVGRIVDRADGYVMTQSTTAAKPTVVSEGVEFDGVDDVFETTLDAVPYDFQAPFTVVVSCTVDPSMDTGFHGVVGRFHGPGDSSWDLGVHEGKMRFAARGTSNIDTGLDPPDVRPLGRVVVAYRVAANNVEYVRGALTNIIDNPGTWTPDAGNSVFSLGGRQGASRFWGILHHVLIFDALLSDTDLTQVLDYLDAEAYS